MPSGLPVVPSPVRVASVLTAMLPPSEAIVRVSNAPPFEVTRSVDVLPDGRAVPVIVPKVPEPPDIVEPAPSLIVPPLIDAIPSVTVNPVTVPPNIDAPNPSLIVPPLIDAIPSVTVNPVTVPPNIDAPNPSLIVPPLIDAIPSVNATAVTVPPAIVEPAPSEIVVNVPVAGVTPPMVVASIVPPLTSTVVNVCAPVQLLLFVKLMPSGLPPEPSPISVASVIISPTKEITPLASGSVYVRSAVNAGAVSTVPWNPFAAVLSSRIN